MSILYENENGYFISHAKFIKQIYQSVTVKEKKASFEILEDIFKINHPYVKLKSIANKGKRKANEMHNGFKSEVEFVRNLYNAFRSILTKYQIIYNGDDAYEKNTEALDAAQSVYTMSGTNNIENVIGENKNEAIRTLVAGVEYLFPTNCKFYCSNVNNIEKHLGSEKYNLILLDPPWWNKYIRRKKMKTNNSYVMMYNNDLKELPVENLITDDGLVVVWCTNAVSHLDYLKNEIFKKWDLIYLTKWYWIKIAIHGEPVCKFSDPPGKQPFEQIIFACKNKEKYNILTDHKLIVSVPSALHSHKPPLQEILQKFVPENSKCLEIFARYLLPNWTSYGLEAIRFQHHSLYKMKQ